MAAPAGPPMHYLRQALSVCGLAASTLLTPAARAEPHECETFRQSPRVAGNLSVTLAPVPSQTSVSVAAETEQQLAPELTWQEGTLERETLAKKRTDCVGLQAPWIARYKVRRDVCHEQDSALLEAALRDTPSPACTALVPVGLTNLIGHPEECQRVDDAEAVGRSRLEQTCRQLSGASASEDVRSRALRDERVADAFVSDVLAEEELRQSGDSTCLTAIKALDASFTADENWIEAWRRLQQVGVADWNGSDRESVFARATLKCNVAKRRRQTPDVGACWANEVRRAGLRMSDEAIQRAALLMNNEAAQCKATLGPALAVVAAACPTSTSGAVFEVLRLRVRGDAVALAHHFKGFVAQPEVQPAASPASKEQPSSPLTIDVVASARLFQGWRFDDGRPALPLTAPIGVALHVWTLGYVEISPIDLGQYVRAGKDSTLETPDVFDPLGLHATLGLAAGRRPYWIFGLSGGVARLGTGAFGYLGVSVGPAFRLGKLKE